MGSPRIQEFLVFQKNSLKGTEANTGGTSTTTHSNPEENGTATEGEPGPEGAENKNTQTRKDVEGVEIFTLKEAEKEGLVKQKPNENWGKGLPALLGRLQKCSTHDEEGGGTQNSPQQPSPEDPHKGGILEGVRGKSKAIEAPNISLNIAARTETWEIALATVFGVLVQIAVLVVTGIITYDQRWSFKKGGITVQGYSYRMYAISDWISLSN
jgi:hypothetical protein